MASTYRPLNECDRCGYTWHSRGSNYSLKCPNCGCRDHHEVVDGHGIQNIIQGIITLGVLGIIGFIGINFISIVLSTPSSSPTIQRTTPEVLPPSLR